ncbi:TraB/GumN family protein [Roseateles violae]|uniref:TraB/GumN family protein n=1 Tax=Roseateles violae TaxID=3058042 RepID=A0ABT8DTQ6_9BURK|nr:TraB/GumN family protein [Pelomonas sp. PFR6]MDN3919561.1 TraB/GumN family protein [Pelomonas sp. PFR6]
MKALAAWGLALALLVGPAPARADCPPPVAAPTAAELQTLAATAVDHGFLWRLRRDGHESWLFGSLHLGRPAWALPGPALREAWRRSELLAVELDAGDPATLQALREAARPAAPLSPALQQRLAAQARAACLPEQALAALHPILQLSALTMLAARHDGLDAGFGQEAVLLALARAEGRPIVALESAAEQMRALIPADPAEQRRALAAGLEQLEREAVRAPMRRLAEAWARGDLAELQDYARWCDCVHDEEDRRWLKRVNDDRNGPLAARIAALHGGGQRLLVAVGALHMSGPQALPRLLAELGFEVERVKPH